MPTHPSPPHDPPRHDPLLRAVLDAAAVVHRDLGAGLGAVVYRVALEQELVDRGIEIEHVLAPGEPPLLVLGRELVLAVRGAGDPPEDLGVLARTLRLAGLALALYVDFDVFVLLAGVRRVYASAEETDAA